MSLETAGKVFIGLTFALLAGGVIALHAALHLTLIPCDRISAQYDYVVIRRTQRLRPPVPITFIPFGR